jgi:hypothetical protein
MKANHHHLHCEPSRNKTAAARLLSASRWRGWVTCALWCLALFALSTAAIAQFKEIGPPPFSPTVARQKIRALLEKVDPSNRRETIDTLYGWLVWYRDLLNEELIAAWKGGRRANLPDVIESLADSQVASAIVEFSWREQRQSAFNLTYAPMFVNLMARFPESAKPFLDDLLGATATGHPTPNLSQPEADAVCRILLDMPDVGTWKSDARKILPHYRLVAERLLAQDLSGNDREKSYQARLWLADLQPAAPDPSQRQSPRGNSPVPTSPAAPRVTSDPAPEPAPVIAAPARPPLLDASVPKVPLAYSGAKSGTFECSGAPISQNAEYVFRNVPLVKMQLDYDTRIWDARLVPGEEHTQRLILKNKSSGPHKSCTVHWSVIP